jgi:predicted amidophosphoribosyltransferase
MGGPPAVCVACARSAIELTGAERCAVCSQTLGDDGQCANRLCHDPHRRITRIRAIAVHSGELRSANHRLKYEGKWGWAAIFGRLLLGSLEAEYRPEDLDIIIANPTYTGPGGAVLAHTERVVEAAEREDLSGRWPFDVATPRAIVKTSSTSRSAGQSFASKQAAAAELPSALAIPDPSRIRDGRILVYDDVCTTGSQLDALARHLITAGGARSVEAIVLARAPWR